MKKPSKRKIKEWIESEFPNLVFDGIKMEDAGEHRCHFQIISYGRIIGQADYTLGDSFWNDVRAHLKWQLG